MTTDIGVLGILIICIIILLCALFVTMQIILLYNKKLWKDKIQRGFHCYRHKGEAKEIIGFICWKGWYRWINEDVSYLKNDVWTK